MGNKTELKLTVLSLLFLGICLFTYGWGAAEKIRNRPPLDNFLKSIEGYSVVDNLQLPGNAVNMLNLDDYFYAEYRGEIAKINLYVGYYYSADKAYAAHSPTICYPSQGWKIEKAKAGSMMVGSQIINYDEIITTFGQQKELVIYWYQARLQTNTQVYRNKVSIGYNKLVFDDQSHGFVRVAAPFGNYSYKQVRNEIQSFINSFYPQFERYLTN